MFDVEKNAHENGKQKINKQFSSNYENYRKVVLQVNIQIIITTKLPIPSRYSINKSKKNVKALRPPLP